MKPVNLVLLIFLPTIIADNITSTLNCYQCKKNTDVECGADALKPCPSASDRCVTHIKKNAREGYVVSRECGLAPCAFDDEMVAKGLGFDRCHRDRDEYSCIFCCKESGCNKSDGSARQATLLLTVLSMFGRTLH